MSKLTKIQRDRVQTRVERRLKRILEKYDLDPSPDISELVIRHLLVFKYPGPFNAELDQAETDIEKLIKGKELQVGDIVSLRMVRGKVRAL